MAVYFVSFYFHISYLNSISIFYFCFPVTPVKDDPAGDSDDDEDLVPAFRKRKKSTVLQSPTTPTFKTPGKPPRKLSRLSTKGSSNVTRKGNLSGDSSAQTPAVPLDKEAKEISRTSNDGCLLSSNASRAQSPEVFHDKIASKGRLDWSDPTKKSPLSERVSNKKTATETNLELSPLDRKSIVLQDKISKEKMAEQTNLKSPVVLRKPFASDSDSDEDVVPVGRKRRAMALMSPLSQVVKSPEALMERLQNRLKKPGNKTSKVGSL